MIPQIGSSLRQIPGNPSDGGGTLAVGKWFTSRSVVEKSMKVLAEMLKTLQLRLDIHYNYQLFVRCFL